MVDYDQLRTPNLICYGQPWPTHDMKISYEPTMSLSVIYRYDPYMIGVNNPSTVKIIIACTRKLPTREHCVFAPHSPP